MRPCLKSSTRWLRVVVPAAAIIALLGPFAVARAGSVLPLAPVTEADGRLGLCNVLPGAVPAVNGPTWAQLAYNAGARINRWELRWDRIEPQPGQWDFSGSDPAVAASLQTGLQVLGIVDGIPGWAAAHGQPPGNGVPRGLTRAPDDPRNLWAAFLRGLVTHYRGQVKYWEIWNEPDLPFFWHGSPAAYARLLQVAYLTIKQVDPGARVLMAGMVVPDFGFVGSVLDDLRHPAAGMPATAFDVAAWHAYGPTSTLAANLQQFRAILAARGFGDAPLWVTEDGFPASNPTGEARQAAYVLQTITYALAAGANRVLIYRASDDSSAREWGIMSAAGDLRQAYVAFQVAARYFAHTTSVVTAARGGLERFVLYQPSRRVVVAWTHGLAGAALSLPAGHPAAAAVNWDGVESVLPAIGGYFHTDVPGATYNRGVDSAGVVVGGPPTLVIEDNAVPTGLAAPNFVAPVPGNNRQLLLLNSAATPVSIVVSAVGNPRDRQVVQLAPDTVGLVDLDLLAGSTYGDMYAIAATGPVSAEAASDGATAQQIQPSADWYLPTAPTALTITTASGAATATITTYTRSGRVSSRRTLALAPGRPAIWTQPGRNGRAAAAVTLHATGPVLVSGPASAPVPAAPAARTAWYLVRPRSPHLTVFNPAAVGSQVELRFIGASTVRSEQLRLAPHRSFVAGTHGARAVVLTATGPVAVDDPGDSTASSPVPGQAATQLGVALAGATTRINLFNPSAQAAHISLSVITGKGSRQESRVLRPLAVTAFRARPAGGPPSGVVLRSDVPVVAAPAP